MSTATSELELAITQQVLADAELEKLTIQARIARNSYEREKLTAAPADFAKLRDAAQQAQLKADAAKKAADEKRAAADELRSSEHRRMLQEQATRALNAKECEYENARTTLLNHRAQLATLSRSIPSEERRLGCLLSELVQLRQRAQAAP